MFCSNCGKPATGNFCSFCGAPLVQPDTRINIENPHLSWRDEPTIKALISNAEVIQIINNYSDSSAKRISAEEALGMFDSILKPALGGVSLKKVGEIVVPLFQQMGIETGKSCKKSISLSLYETIVKVLCSLAKNSYPVSKMKEGHNGLIIIDSLPSNVLSWGGEILITMERTDNKTDIEINAKIKGQLYDWGRSKKVIANITTDIDTIELR